MAEASDGARAWIVAIAAFTINLITAGIYRAQGILFVSFISSYGADRKEASLPFSVRTAIRNLLAPPVGILGQKYGIPSVVISGGILSVVSSILCSFATEFLWITIGWGVINGIAMALVTVLPQVVIGQYFIKHRTTASGLAFSGGCLGAFVFPVILEILLQHYGLEGTFFILAGMFLHIIPAAMILKKPAWLMESKHISSKSEMNYSVKNKCTVKDSKTVEDISKSSNGKSNPAFSTDHDSRQYDVCNHNATSLSPRNFGYLNSAEGMSTEMQTTYFNRGNMTSSVNNIELNYRTIKANSNYIFDVDLDYLKRMSDIVFQMFSMEIPNIEMSYRAILLEVEHDNIWHPEKEEIMQEIESICLHIEKTFEMTQGSDNIIEANGLYMKRTLLNGALPLSKKTQSLRAVKKHLRTYKERSLLFGKIRSAPNMSNIYNELARKDYIITKMRQLNNCNEIRIISLLCQYNPRDVLRVLFHVRSLYKLYNEIEPFENGESTGLDEPSDNKEDDEDEDWIEIKHKCVSAESEAETKINSSPSRENSFGHHIKAAIKLHTNPIFLLLCCCRTAYFLNFSPVMTIIVDFAMDKGLQEEDGKFLIGAVSLGDLIGRLGLGWITDHGYASLPRYMFVVMMMQGVSTISLPLMHSRWTILPSVSLYGMLLGSLFVRHPVLVAKYLKPDQQSIAVGCMEFSAGVTCLIIPVYIGFFRDNIGSYNPIFYINGAVSILAGIGWLFEPCIMKRRSKHQES